MTLRIVLEPDAEFGGYAVWVPELPGCASQGETRDEALANIRDAIELYLRPLPLDLQGRELVELTV